MTDATNAELVSYLAWSLRVLERGVFPCEDYAGNPWPPGSWREQMGREQRPIAGPYSAAFSAVTHDAKARKETHNFANFYSCNYICNLCPACKHRPLLSYANFKASAKHRQYILSHEGYMASRPLQQLTPWHQLPGFDHIRALYDAMHSLHLGIGKDITAQLCYDLCRFGLVGDVSKGLDSQLQTLWQEFRRWCRANSMKYSRRKITAKVIGMSEAGKFPEMNSRTKAAHIKPLAHFLAWRWRCVVQSGGASREHKLRAWCIFGLSDALFVFDKAGVLLTQEEADRAFRSGRTCLVTWQELACLAIDKGETNYKLRPKGHYVDHILHDMHKSRENPRVLSNFMDEDFIGKIVAQAKQQHRANVVPRTIELYVMLLRHRWQSKSCARLRAPEQNTSRVLTCLRGPERTLHIF